MKLYCIRFLGQSCLHRNRKKMSIACYSCGSNQAVWYPKMEMGAYDTIVPVFVPYACCSISILHKYLYSTEQNRKSHAVISTRAKPSIFFLLNRTEKNIATRIQITCAAWILFIIDCPVSRLLDEIQTTSFLYRTLPSTISRCKLGH